ncbi:hypothetical protein [Bradyrhizobium murdochi]|uniref:hypothetical protein n=1 Tax=Bradyrhizobium murdochi TaxID=1038859 RepID=UPI0012ECABD8|nr:hypothetical protein [Bradyrhizobium murdochi]
MPFIEFIRAPSALVLLFWGSYALPLVPGMPSLSPIAAAILSPIAAAIFVLVLDGAAYGAEIVRAGIEAVHRGQTDVCQALELRKLQSFKGCFATGTLADRARFRQPDAEHGQVDRDPGAGADEPS